MTSFALKEGLLFSDLYDRDGLVRVDRAFIAHLAGADPTLHDRLVTARRDPATLDRAGESDLVVELAPYVEDFAAELFGIVAKPMLCRSTGRRSRPSSTRLMGSPINQPPPGSGITLALAAV